MHTLVCDAGKVELKTETVCQLKEWGINVDPASPECQYQNFVERSVQTACKGTATLLTAQNLLDHTFWGLALLHFTHVYNCTPNTNSGEQSPMFLLTG